MARSGRIVPILLIIFSLVPLGSAEGFPPDPPGFEAGLLNGDGSLNETREVTLYFVSADGVTLRGASHDFSGDEKRSVVEGVLEELLTSPLNLRFRVGSPEVALNGLEEAGGIVTLDLSADAGSGLDAQERYTFFASIADTLLGIDGVHGVNILIGGRATQTEGLPTGAFTLNSGNVPALFAQLGNEGRRVSGDPGAVYLRNVCLYHPAAEGDLCLPRVRTLSFGGDEKQNILTILGALTDAAYVPEGCEPLPDCFASGSLDPVVAVNASGARILTLNARDLTDDERLWRAATLTLCTYLPGLDAVCFDGRGGDVILTRRDGSDHIGGSAAICFADAATGKLVRRNIITTPRKAASALERLRTAADATPPEGYGSIFPEGISGADILGLSLIEQTAVVDLSGNFYVRCQGLDEACERRLIYGMIDMVCASRGLRAMRFVFDGESVEALSGGLYLGTALMPDPNIIESED